MSRGKIVAGVLAVAVAGGVTVVALWDSLPWAGDDKNCAAPSATVRTELPVPSDAERTHPMMSPDGRHVLYPTAEPRLLDVGTGKVVRAYDGGFVEVGSFRADGSSFVSEQMFENENGRAEGVALWTVNSDKAVQVFPVDEPFVAENKRRGRARGVAVSPDGKLVAISTVDGAVRLWDVKTGLIAAVLKERSELADGTIFPESSLAFSPDGKLVALGDNDGKVSVWQTGSRELEQQFTAPGSGSIELVFSPDSRYLAVREYGPQDPAYNQDAWVVELATGRGVQVPNHLSDPVTAMRFTPDSAALVTATVRGTVARTTLADGRTTELLQVCGADHMMVGADAGTAVALAVTDDRSAYDLMTYPLP